MFSKFQNPDGEQKDVWFHGELLVEQADAICLQPGDTVTFVNWGNMRVAEVKRDAKTGEVDSVIVDLDLENKVFEALKNLNNSFCLTKGLQENNESHLVGQCAAYEKFHGENCPLQPHYQQTNCGQGRGLETVRGPGERGNWLQMLLNV